MAYLRTPSLCCSLAFPFFRFIICTLLELYLTIGILSSLLAASCSYPRMVLTWSTVAWPHMGCTLQPSLFLFSWSHYVTLRHHTVRHPGYEDMPATGESFEGKSVMILGMGNAAIRIQLGNLGPAQMQLEHVGTGGELESL